MKKLSWFVLCLCISSVSWGEGLSFVTTMSGPVGSFSQVDTTDRATAKIVTFYNVGTIKLNAASNYRTAELGNVTVNGGNLISSATKFKTKNMSLTDEGILKAGRLVTQSITTGNTKGTMVVLGTLYGNNSTEIQVNRLGVLNRLVIGNQSQISADVDRIPGVLSWNSVGTATILQGSVE